MPGALAVNTGCVFTILRAAGSAVPDALAVNTGCVLKNLRIVVNVFPKALLGISKLTKGIRRRTIAAGGVASLRRVGGAAAYCEQSFSVLHSHAKGAGFAIILFFLHHHFVVVCLSAPCPEKSASI